MHIRNLRDDPLPLVKDILCRRMIKSRIKAHEHAITNLADLKKAVLPEWDQITIEDVRKLTRTMPERMQQARHRRGAATAF